MQLQERVDRANSRLKVYKVYGKIGSKLFSLTSLRISNQDKIFTSFLKYMQNNKVLNIIKFAKGLLLKEGDV